MLQPQGLFSGLPALFSAWNPSALPLAAPPPLPFFDCLLLLVFLQNLFCRKCVSIAVQEALQNRGEAAFASVVIVGYQDHFPACGDKVNSVVKAINRAAPVTSYCECALAFPVCAATAYHTVNISLLGPTLLWKMNS